ncbi:MAG: HD domain-containing phosphohydrolase [Usitatibacteraceae bacterium]
MILNAEPELAKPLSLAASLDAAATRILDATDPQSYRAFEGLLRRMRTAHSVADARAGSTAALQLCQRLYRDGRSFDALPFGRANLALAEQADDAILMRRAHTAFGLLLGDTADIAGAMDHHTQALRIAMNANDAVEMSRIWNNIGMAFNIAGNYPLATACFKRVLALLESEPSPVFSRYTSFGNLAHSLFHMGEFGEGQQYATMAAREMTPAMAAQDGLNPVILHRNNVRLLVALGRLEEAKVAVQATLEFAAKASTPRAKIAAATAQAAYEMACGNSDLGLTRLDQALVFARSVPATLRDTLVCVIRAEEQAGFPAHALVRLHELSDHVYRTAIGQMRKHVELADIVGMGDAISQQPHELAKARLTSSLSSPVAPVEWKTLQRLAVGAAFRIDSTGWHGIRVGVLTQALAIEYGVSHLEALEFGLAAQLHDIGMASVPEGVLSQAAALNDTERGLVQKHTVAGAEMLAGDQHPRMVIASDIIKYHHARWDGEGYPRNVAGKSIPLAARMCAVADVYDTLVTDRPYRKAWSMDRAFAELQRVAGTQLDPDLVRSFESVIRRESANEGIDPSIDDGLENFQQLIAALTEDRGFI